MSARDLLQRLRSLFAFGAVRSAGHDIFISYRREPEAKAYAKALRDALEERGKRCFFDEHSLATGDDIERLKKEARRSRMFLLVGTRSIFESVHIPAELAAYDEAHRGWIRRRLRRIFPINVRRALTPYEMPTEDLKKDPGPWKPLLGLVTEPETDERFDSGEPSPELVTRIGQSSGLVNSTQIMLAIMAAIAFCIAGLGVATLYFGRSVAEGRSELAKLEKTRQETVADNRKLAAEQTRLEGEQKRLSDSLIEGQKKLEQAAKDLDDATEETNRQRGLAEEAALRATLQRGETYASEGFNLLGQSRLELAATQFDAAARIAGDTKTRNFIADVGLTEVYRRRPPSLWSLAAHDGGVNAVEFSPDGRFLLTGGHAKRPGDPQLVLWDARSGQRLQAFEGHGKGVGRHDAEVRDVAFSPDGKTVASAGSDGTIRIWDRETGKQRGILFQSEHVMTAVAFTSDGRSLVAGGYENDVRVWNLGTGHLDEQYPVASLVDGVAVGGKDDRYIVVTTLETVILFDRAAKQPRWTIDGHEDGNERVSFAGTDTVVVAGVDGTVAAWSVENGGRISRSGTHATSHTIGETRAVAATPDGAMIYGTRDDEIAIALIANGDLLQTYFHEHSGTVTDIAVSPSEPLFASASTDGTVRLWTAGRDLERSFFESKGMFITGLDVSIDGRLLVSTTYDGAVTVRDSETLLPLASLDADSVGDVLFSVGATVVTAGWNGPLSYRDLQKQTDPRQVPADVFSTNSIARSADGNWMLSSEAGVAVVRKLADGSRRGELPVGRAISAMALTRDGGVAFAGTEAGTLHLWSLRDGYPIHQQPVEERHAREVVATAFLGDGARAASCDEDGKIFIVDTTNGKTISVIEGSGQELLACVAHPSGRWLAASAEDGSVRLWDVDNATQVGVLFHGEQRRFENMSFDSTGDRLFVSVYAPGSSGGFVWNFQRAAEYRRLGAAVPAALAAERKGSATAADHRILGEWYALRGIWAWAAAHFETARAGGAVVPHLTLGRVYVRDRKTAQARRELEAGVASSEIDRAYGRLLLGALTEKSPSAPVAGQRRP